MRIKIGKTREMKGPGNMSTSTDTIEQLSINTIRTLSMDAVQKGG